MKIPYKFNPFGKSKNQGGGSGIPTRGLVFYAPLTDYTATNAETGQPLICSSSSSIQISNQISNQVFGAIPCILFTRYSLIYTESSPIVGNQSFTQSIWFSVRTDSMVRTNMPIFTFGQPGNYTQILLKYYNISGNATTFRCTFGGYALVDGYFNTTFQCDKWYNIVQTYDANTGVFKAYVNGVYDNTGTDSRVNITNYRISIGGWPDYNTSSCVRNTYMTAARIYDRVLSEDEITALAHEFTPMFEINASDQTFSFYPVQNQTKSIVYSCEAPVTSFEIISGALPSSITFDTSTGQFYGKSLTDADHVYNLIVRMSGDNIVPKDITVILNCYSSSILNVASQQQIYFYSGQTSSYNLDITTDNETPTASLYYGTLPQGVSLNQSGNNISIDFDGQQTVSSCQYIQIAVTTPYHQNPVYSVIQIKMITQELPSTNDLKLYAPLTDEFITKAQTGQTITYSTTSTNAFINRNIQGIACIYATANNIITIPDTGFNSGNNNFSISFWVYGVVHDGNNTRQTLLSFGSESLNKAFNICYIQDSTYCSLGVVGAGSAVNQHYGSTNLTILKQWNHICIVRNNGTETIYINGSAYTSFTYTRNIVLNGSLRVNRASFTGSSNGATSNSCFTALRFYNRVLSTSQIALLANEFSPKVLTGYSQIQYIEANGTQYINTGITPTNNNFKVEIDCYGYHNQGFRQAYSSNEFRLSNGNNADFGFASTIQRVINNSASNSRVIYTMTTDGKILLNHALLYEATGTLTKFYPFYLFAINSDNSPVFIGNYTGRIYHVRMWQDGVLIADMAPVIRNSDNVAGLYNYVNDTFLTNSGTGSFITP